MSARPSLATRLASVATPAKPETPLAVPAEAGRRVTAKVKSPSPVAASKARDGKTMVAGYFSQDLARAVKSVQAIIGEGLDAVLREHGKHPFGER